MNDTGSVSETQESMFEAMRTRLTHGEVLANTFDIAVKKRCSIDPDRSDDDLPPEVDEATFDADLGKIRGMSDCELDSLDREIMHARMERWDESGSGVFVDASRVAGFGRDVFALAYDAITKRWCVTNEFGMHAHCERFLRYEIEMECGEEFSTWIMCGFIFSIPSIKTPVLTPYGYSCMPRNLLKQAVEELWAWKKFILIDDVKINPKKRRYSQLFTADYAESIPLME